MTDPDWVGLGSRGGGEDRKYLRHTVLTTTRAFAIAWNKHRWRCVPFPQTGLLRVHTTMNKDLSSRRTDGGYSLVQAWSSTNNEQVRESHSGFEGLLWLSCCWVSERLSPLHTASAIVPTIVATDVESSDITL